MLSDWLPILFYTMFAAAIPATMIVLSFVLPGRPRTRTRQRMLPFESGVSQGSPSQERRFTVSFYLTAMLFILFDIEAAFLFPWAVTFKQFSADRLFVLGEMGVFLGILIAGFVYVWSRGALEWE